MRRLHEIYEALDELEHNVANFTEDAYNELYYPQMRYYEEIRNHSNITDPKVW
jgi:hypothetical protein